MAYGFLDLNHSERIITQMKSVKFIESDVLILDMFPKTLPHRHDRIFYMINLKAKKPMEGNLKICKFIHQL